MTKLSMTAPGLRERAVGAGLLPGELLLRVPQSTWGGGRHMGSGSRQGPGAAGQGTQPLLQTPPNSRVKPQVGSRAQQAPPVSVLLGHKERWRSHPSALVSPALGVLAATPPQSGCAVLAWPWGQAASEDEHSKSPDYTPSPNPSPGPGGVLQIGQRNTLAPGLGKLRQGRASPQQGWEGHGFVPLGATHL